MHNFNVEKQWKNIVAWAGLQNSYIIASIHRILTGGPKRAVNLLEKYTTIEYKPV